MKKFTFFFLIFIPTLLFSLGQKNDLIFSFEEQIFYVDDAIEKMNQINIFTMDDMETKEKIQLISETVDILKSTLNTNSKNWELYNRLEKFSENNIKDCDNDKKFKDFFPEKIRNLIYQNVFIENHIKNMLQQAQEIVTNFETQKMPEVEYEKAKQLYIDNYEVLNDLILYHREEMKWMMSLIEELKLGYIYETKRIL